MGWLKSAKETVLYWASGSPPCWRAMIVLDEKGLDYESRLIELGKKQHKSDEVLKINPRGQVGAEKVYCT